MDWIILFDGVVDIRSRHALELPVRHFPAKLNKDVK